ncbi:MAG TPA: hypothetical protein VN622_11130 [Clostridia bacterium]|nr:hypothetical protein [Clostridia bacterium]
MGKYNVSFPTILLYGAWFPEWSRHEHDQKGMRFRLARLPFDLHEVGDDASIEAVVMHEASLPPDVDAWVSNLREVRPKVEVLICGEDLSLVDRMTASFDGFVINSGKADDFADAVRLVLARCCARKRRGKTKCRHTGKAAHA